MVHIENNFQSNWKQETYLRRRWDTIWKDLLRWYNKNVWKYRMKMKIVAIGSMVDDNCMFAPALLQLCFGFALAWLQLCTDFALALLRLWSGFAPALLWLFFGFAPAMLRLCSSFAPSFSVFDPVLLQLSSGFPALLLHFFAFLLHFLALLLFCS